MTEHHHQVLTVAWFRATYPHLAQLLFAIPNGGKRNPATAALLKAEGVVPGIPDLFLAVPVGKQHGLFIEMKNSTGSASKAQKSAHAILATQGYEVALAHGYEAAKTAIRGYLA
jgi:hypothetical protein